MHYLYKITNNKNGLIYIGQAINIRRRWAEYKRAAAMDNPPQEISRAMKQDGIDNFSIEWIATCVSKQDANSIETSLVAQYKSNNKVFGYNRTPGGDNKSEEWKQHMSNVMSGEHNPRFGKISAFRGKKHTTEARAKMSAATKGKPSIMKGKRHSQEA